MISLLGSACFGAVIGWCIPQYVRRSTMSVALAFFGVGIVVLVTSVVVTGKAGGLAATGAGGLAFWLHASLRQALARIQKKGR